jgi:hypothetical protein
MRHRRTLLALALAAALPAGAATATDARQYTIGLGAHPTVAVDTTPRPAEGAPRGWVHVAWATTSGFPESEGVRNAIGYCRLPIGGRACRDRQTLLVLGRFAEFAAPELWRTDDGAIVITDGRAPEADLKGRWTLTSSDAGRTWTAAHVSVVERGNSGLLSRARLLEVLDPADGSLTSVGSSFFSFGFPVNVFRVPRGAVAPPVTAAPEPAPFAADGARTVDTEVLGRLPDGRLFAAGRDRADPGGTGYARVAQPGADVNLPGAWTAWQPLGVTGSFVGVAYAPGAGPTLLMHRTGTQDNSLAASSYDGARVGPPRPLSGDTGAGSPLAADLTANGADRHGAWVSDAEGCRRGGRCVVYTRLTPAGAAGPRWVARVLADTPAQPVLELPAVAGAGDEGFVVWQERTPNRDGFPTIRLAHVIEAHRRPLPRAAGRVATLEAPNLVAGRTVVARVTAGAAIRRATISLRPPVCRPRATGDGCHALRRPVTVVRTRAPFTLRVAGLPVARTISTTDPRKNRDCGVDAYLYLATARVVTAAGTVTLRRNVSVCPPCAERGRRAGRHPVRAARGGYLARRCPASAGTPPTSRSPRHGCWPTPGWPRRPGSASGCAPTTSPPGASGRATRGSPGRGWAPRSPPRRSTGGS